LGRQPLLLVAPALVLVALVLVEEVEPVLVAVGVVPPAPPVPDPPVPLEAPCSRMTRVQLEPVVTSSKMKHHATRRMRSTSVRLATLARERGGAASG
jgi:hypothetical protein